MLLLALIILMHPCMAQGYPTVILFPRDRRPTNKYEGPRQVDHMKAFLQQHYLKPRKPEPKKRKLATDETSARGKLRSPCNDTSWFFNKRGDARKVARE